MKLEGFTKITRDLRKPNGVQPDLRVLNTAYFRLSKKIVDKYKLEERRKVSVFADDNGHIILTLCTCGDRTLSWGTSGSRVFYLPKKYGYLEGVYDLVEDDIDESINRVWLKFSKREEQ